MLPVLPRDGAVMNIPLLRHLTPWLAHLRHRIADHTEARRKAAEEASKWHQDETRRHHPTEGDSKP